MPLWEKVPWKQPEELNLTVFPEVITKELINEVQEGFKDTIKELEDALTQYQKDDKRKIAISNQINKCKQGGLLNYYQNINFCQMRACLLEL